MSHMGAEATQAAARSMQASSIDLAAVHQMSKPSLFELQQRFGLGSTWGEISFPREWMPAGPSQKFRRVDVRDIQGPDEELARLTFARLALLAWLYKSHYHRARFLKPTTIVQRLIQTRTMLLMAIGRSVLDERRIFDRLRSEDFLASGDTNRSTLYSWLCDLGNRSLWLDLPVNRSNIGDATALEILKTPERERAETPGHLPFSDDFVAAAGWRYIWLAEMLASSLIECAKRVVEVRGPANLLITSKQRTAACEAVRNYLRSFRWRSTDGSRLDSLPFNISIGYPNNGSHLQSAFCWPPQSFADILNLVHLLQDAHLFLLLLCTGGRVSEIASMKTDCIVSNRKNFGRVSGRTFKLVTTIGGEQRDWPVPPLTLKAIEQQIELRDVIDKLSFMFRRRRQRGAANASRSLWITVAGNDFTQCVNQRLNNSIAHLELSGHIDGRGVHTHRFRKTIARLVALALVGAPKILMDLFGHADIEMTLHYILTDPAIRAEMEEIARAQTIMLAEDAISTIDRCGGKAAVAIREARDRERARLGVDYGPDSVKDLAEILTSNGEAWALVRENVICTKQPGQVGPCNRKRGNPDPASCRATCWHRLELEAARDEADRCISQQLAQLQNSIEADDEFQMEIWKGQLLATLPRFPDLQQKWSAQPLIQQLLAESSPRVDAPHPFDDSEHA